jgi:hypothetical protein
MTYTKPEVLLLGPASDAIQGTGKPGGHIDGSGDLSSGAYEADE